MTLAMASALMTAIALGLWFSTTRGLAIVATAIMVASQPWLVVPVVVGSAIAFYVFRIRK